MCGNARRVDIATKYDFGIDYLELDIPFVPNGARPDACLLFSHVIRFLRLQRVHCTTFS